MHQLVIKGFNISKVFYSFSIDQDCIKIFMLYLNKQKSVYKMYSAIVLLT